MLIESRKNGLYGDALNNLQFHVNAYVSIFRLSFSAGPSSNVIPLKVDFTETVNTVWVRFRKYLQ